MHSGVILDRASSHHYVDYAMTNGVVVRADKRHGNRCANNAYRRELEFDDWDKLLARLGIRVPGAPVAIAVRRQTTTHVDYGSTW